MDILIGILSLLVNWLIGGGMSKLLDAIPPIPYWPGKRFYFKAWHPDPFWKSTVVLVVSCAFGGLVTFLINYAIPNGFGHLPEGLQAFLVAQANFIAMFIKNTNTKTAQFAVGSNTKGN